MDKIMGNIAEVIQDALDGPALDQSIRLEEFESIKDYLSVMVVNTAENRKLLEQVPHKEVADLSLLCYADLPVDQGGYNATFKITEQMLQKWNVDREELFQIASENTISANEPVLQNLEEVTRQILMGGAAPENLLKKEFDFSNQEVMMNATELSWYYILYLFASLMVVLGVINLWMFRKQVWKTLFAKTSGKDDDEGEEDDE